MGGDRSLNDICFINSTIWDNASLTDWISIQNEFACIEVVFD